MGSDDTSPKPSVVLSADGKNIIQWRHALRANLTSRSKHYIQLINFIDGTNLRRPLDLPSPEQKAVTAAEEIWDIANQALLNAPPGTATANAARNAALGRATEALSDAQWELVKSNKISPAAIFDQAESQVIQTIADSVSPSHRSRVWERKPIDVLKWFEGEYLPKTDASIAMIESKLNLLIVKVHKTHPYYSVVEYFDQIEALANERKEIDGSIFNDQNLLHTMQVALAELSNQKIDNMLLMWRTTSAKDEASLSSTKLIEFMRHELFSSLQVQTTINARRERTQPAPPTSSVNVAQATNKRGHDDEGMLVPGELVQKRSKSNLRAPTPNVTCSVCTKIGHRRCCTNCNKLGHLSKDCWTGDNAHNLPEKFGGKAGVGSNDSSYGRADSRIQEVSLCLDTSAPLSRVYACKGQSQGHLEQADRSSGAWHVDSGATDWICKYKASFVTYEDFPAPRPILLGDNSIVYALGDGTVKIHLQDCVLLVNRVLLAPDMGVNLISARRIAERGGRVVIDERGCVISARGVNIVADIDAASGLYTLWERPDLQIDRTSLRSEPETYSSVLIATSEERIARANLQIIQKPSRLVRRWHRKLGHLRYEAVKGVLRRLGVKEDILEDTEEDADHVCEVCVYGKATQHPYRSPPSHPATEPLELLHIDGNGPWQSPSLHKRHAGAQGTNATHSLSKYVLVVVDDYTGFVWTRYYTTRDNFRNAFIHLITHAEADAKVKGLKHKVSRIRMDNAKEFTSGDIESLCENKGIQMEPTAPYAHEQNGVAERMNRTLREMSSTMLIESGLPEGFWAEAVRTATYTKNRCPNRSRHVAPAKDNQATSPYERFHGKPPTYGHLQTFGCATYTSIPFEKRVKVLSQRRAWKGIFLGYTGTDKQYRVWDLERKVISIARDVKCVEGLFPARTDYKTLFPSWRKPHNSDLSLTTVDLDPDDVTQLANLERSHGPDDVTQLANVELSHGPDDVTYIDATDSQPERTQQENSSNNPSASPKIDRAPRRRLISVTIPVRSVDTDPTTSSLPLAQSDLDVPRRGRSKHSVNQIDARACSARIYTAFIAEAVGVPLEPNTWEEAMSLPEAPMWLAAASKEVTSLKTNETFEEKTQVSPYAKVLGARWVFKRKYLENGDVEYKARVVIKGYEQRFGIHYTETYAPVVNLRTIRVLLALAAFLDLEVHQMDVKTAFLNATLPESERVLMQIPKGYSPQSKDTIALLLLKSLYGLKQAPRLWNMDLHEVITSPSFPVRMTQSLCDESLYISNKLIVAVYVDDILLFSRDLSLIEKAKKSLMDTYEMKDLGEARKFLGIRISRDRLRRTIRIDQEEYSNAILERFGYDPTASRPTPMKSGLQLGKDEAKATQLTPSEALVYRSMLGSLLYAALGTRPDLAFTASRLGMFNHNPNEEHWEAMDWAFRYLRRTAKLGITYGGTDTESIYGYTDADYAQMLGDDPSLRRKSTSGYTWHVSGGSVSWSSKLQSTIATSSTEAEVIASNAAGKEGLWLRKLLLEFLPVIAPSRLTTTPLAATKLFVDNKSAMIISAAPGNQQRTKHWDVNHFWIRERITKNELELIYVPTESMTADIFTKSLPAVLHDRHVRGLGLLE